jgi:hypothetical protein
MMSFPFLRRNTHRLSARQTRSFVPRLESLEDRTVLSTLTVLNALDRGAAASASPATRTARFAGGACPSRRPRNNRVAQTWRSAAS